MTGLTTGQTIAVAAVIWVSLAFLIGPLVGLWLRGLDDDDDVNAAETRLLFDEIKEFIERKGITSPDANGSGVDPEARWAPNSDPAGLLSAPFHSATDSTGDQRDHA